MNKIASLSASFQDIEDINVWIFDLDNTLYPITPKMLAEINDLMGSFIADFLTLMGCTAHPERIFPYPWADTEGLMVEHDLDPQEYISHLSQLDLTDVTSNPQLAGILKGLGGRKFIYTNASPNTRVR